MEGQGGNIQGNGVGNGTAGNEPVRMTGKRIGEILLRRDVVTKEQLAEAERLRKADENLSGSLVRLGFLKEGDLVRAYAEQYNVAVLSDIEPDTISTDLKAIVSEDMARRYQFVPLAKEGRKLRVAVADPNHIPDIEQLLRFGKGSAVGDVEISFIEQSGLHRVLDAFYGSSESQARLGNLLLHLNREGTRVISPSEEEQDLEVLQEGANEPVMVQLVSGILQEAVRLKASDIHIEPYEKGFFVRFRIDGILREMYSLPIHLKNSFISRLKIMSNLDIAERRVPQDGRIALEIGKNREVDFRLSILPVLHGEKAVLRVLDRSVLALDLAKMGFNGSQLKILQEAVHAPWGMVLVTGPTGSGKTTTLYSALTELSTRQENISTVEDPVELEVPGVNQVAVNEAQGMTFAAALRSFLRQDPDIIMVGEIRDFETAEIAVKAALTGHMVLSTLHTNDAPSTVNRLLNMGIEPFLVSSSLLLICAQRLVRKVCPHCAEDLILEQEKEALLQSGYPQEYLPATTLKKGHGCSQCGNTGYKGRIGIFEVMPVTEKIKQGIVQGLSAVELSQLAAQEGMITLRQAGFEKIRDGVTTLEEVLRVTRKG